MPTRFRFIPILFATLLLAGVPAVLAQTAPSSLTWQAEGPTGILLTWQACLSSTQDNCIETSYIYRNPPSLDNVLATQDAGDSSTVQYLDTIGLKPATTYNYVVCEGPKAKDSSNCVSTTAKTLPAQSSGGSGGGSGNGSGNQGSGSNNVNTSTPPTNLRALAGDTAVLLDWVNPQSDFPLVIEIYRALTGASGPNQIAILNGDDTVKVPPARYQDNGPLGPHYPYDYYVCSGSYDLQMRNCAHSNTVTAWGLNPIMNAVRSSMTTIKLSVAVDNLTTLSSLRITRQDNSGPCGKGTTLGNGLKGCGTTSYANGVPVNAPVVTTVYDKSRANTSFGASTATAPYLIEIPDDTVTAGVEYYYQAYASWNGVLQQVSDVVTVPSNITLRYLPGHETYATIPTGVKTPGIKPVGPGKAQGKVVMTIPTQAHTLAQTSARTSAQTSAQTASQTATLAAAQANVKAKPTDAQALYTLGQSYCTAKLQDACISAMYMGWLQSQKAGNTALSTQIQTSLAAQGVSATDQK